MMSKLGRTIATFTPEHRLLIPSFDSIPPPLGRILLLDTNGREIWSAGGSPFRAPSER